MKCIRMTFLLEATLNKRLEELARSTHRSKSLLANEAIRRFVELNEWQIGEIEKAVRETDRGEFATDKEVQTLLERINQAHENEPDQMEKHTLERMRQIQRRMIDPKSDSDVWTSTFGAWNRKESTARTTTRARRAFRKSFKRHHP